MVRTVLYFGVVVILVLLGVWCVLDLDPAAEGPSVEKRKYGSEVAEGAVLSRSGYYGVEFVRCGKVRVEKRKYGLLTLGGMNIVVLDGLSVVLPPKDPARDKAAVAEAKGEATAQQVLTELGVEKSLLNQYLGGRRRFSGLRINGLSVSCLETRTNVVPCFVARTGEATREGLGLSGCSVIENGKTNLVGQATLIVKPELKLVWPGGEKRLY